MSSKEKVDRALAAVNNTCYWIFAEGNSLRQHATDFHHSASPSSRRAIRSSAFILGNEVDQLRQHLDELTHALNDMEVEEDMEFTDHGQAPREEF